MKTIIAGSRSLVGVQASWQVDAAIKACGWQITEVVSGCAEGVDTYGEAYARYYNLPLHLYPVFPREWKELGKKAGMIRNARMADNAQALLAVWDGESHGTEGMVNIAKRKGLRVFVWNVLLHGFWQ